MNFTVDMSIYWYLEGRHRPGEKRKWWWNFVLRTELDYESRKCQFAVWCVTIRLMVAVRAPTAAESVPTGAVDIDGIFFVDSICSRAKVIRLPMWSRPERTHAESAERKIFISAASYLNVLMGQMSSRQLKKVPFFRLIVEAFNVEDGCHTIESTWQEHRSDDAAWSLEQRLPMTKR